MTSKKAKEVTEETKKEEPVEVSTEEYAKEHDEDMEGKPISDSEESQLPEDKIKTLQKDIDIAEDFKVKHFDTKTEEFLQKIKDLPRFTEQDDKNIKEHYEDRRKAWELSHATDIAFPIRFKVRGKVVDEIVEYETEDKIEGEKTIQKFKTVEKWFEGQSLTPVHKEKLMKMEQQEASIIRELDLIQHNIQNVVTMRNTIGAIINLYQGADKDKSKVILEEMKSYMKKFETATSKIGDDVGDRISDIQKRADEISNKKNKFIAYAYLSITSENYEDAFFTDIRDYVGVLQRKENLKVPT